MTVTIRNAQLARFREAENDRYAASLLPRLRELFGAELADVNDVELSGKVHAALGRARGYGITHRGGLAGFAALHIWLGAGFDDSDDFLWARAVLHDERLDGPEKMSRLNAEFRRVFGPGAAS